MGMDVATLSTALMQTRPLPAAAPEGEVPEWIHLLPSGEIATDDDRGPYLVEDSQAVIDASFTLTDKIAVDINHATQKLGTQGHEAPAIGWIVEMQARKDGIWGRVEWSGRGRRIMREKAYRGVSPVILHSREKKIMAISMASLTNNPNLRGMTALHQKEDARMDFRAALIKKLGLADDATDDAIMSALDKKMEGGNADTAMQTALGEIAVVFELAEDAAPADIITAAQTAATASKGDEAKDGMIVALQASVKDLGAQIKALTDGQSMQASEAFYERALSEKRAGVNANSKAHLISMHQADPEAAQAFVDAMPKLGATPTTLEPPAPKEGEVSLNTSEKAVAKQMGMSEADYAKARDAQKKEEVA